MKFSRLISVSATATLALLFVVGNPCAPRARAGAPEILPASFSGWAATAKTDYSSSQTASFEPHAAAAATLEFGFDSAEQRTYNFAPPGRAQAKAPLRVTLYQMKDSSAAFGEYLYLRSPDMRKSNLAQNASVSPSHALVLLGNLVLDVSGARLDSDAKPLAALVAAVKPHAHFGPLPAVQTRLPPEKMIPGSARYALGPQTLDQFAPLGSGDWLDFADGAEAALATYRLGRDTPLLIVADYPTPHLAQQTLDALQTRLGARGSAAPSAGPAAQPAHPQIFAKRSFTLLVIVSGASSQAEASVLLNRVHPNEQLTWDEPTTQFTQPSWPVVMAGIIIGTCIFCVFSVVAGLAMGGFRIAIKRAFPRLSAKLFDRVGQMEILQLGISSKPIKAEDFYQFGGR